LPPVPAGKFKRLASRVDFDLNQQKLVVSHFISIYHAAPFIIGFSIEGGHSFPRRSGGIRHTVVPTVSIDLETTKSILKNCKSHGVSISAALFAICNIAWARTHCANQELPM
jgi:hypothetical protein